MKLRTILTTCLVLAAGATAAHGQKPDLTISEFQWRKKPQIVHIVVANIGQAKAAESTGSYACRSAPNEKGISFSFGSLFSIPALLPGQKWKITLNCQGNKITGAVVDTEKKIDEADESNNETSFAAVQIKTGPLQKPGS